MKAHYPKLYNMAHLSLNVFTASKGSNNYILFIVTLLRRSYGRKVVNCSVLFCSSVH